MSRILVLDDEKNLTLVLSALLERQGFEPLVFNDPEQALDALETEPLDAVLTDLAMPGMDGMAILDFVRSRRPELPVILLTAFGTVDAAIAALRRGAFDFVTKPFDQAELIEAVKKAAAFSRGQLREPRLYEQKPGVQPATPTDSFGAVIARSGRMQELLRQIPRIAATDSTVLIHGETGTGKELVARRIHAESPRKSAPFVKLNCAAIPADLLESELFGHERGAFARTLSLKPGRFELADGGTLFLDEIAEIPGDMQARLLRVLQERVFERVGGIQPIPTTVRIVAATHRRLEDEVASGRFRQDLFFQLNVVPLHLPALRERIEDLEPLAGYFLKQACIRANRIVTEISTEALERLRAYSWPGNIRQLENIIERMVVMCDGSRIGLPDLPVEILKCAPGDRGVAPLPEAARTFKEQVRLKTQAVERELIEKELERQAGNVTRTAEALGLSRKGLQLKLKELGLRRDEGDSD